MDFENKPFTSSNINRFTIINGWYPIFAGFFAKLFLFDQMIQSGFIALVIVAVINSIISVILF
jgi:NADH-quinone oxidoreductase subunit N